MTAVLRTLTLAALLAGGAQLIAPSQAQAQDPVKVRGTVADSAGVGLRNAMVVILTSPDSVLAKYTLSNGDGHFEIDRVDPGDYILQITLVGHQTLRQDMTVAGTDVEAGRLTLPVLAIEMEPLVISVDHVPFASRGDTLDFNANAFQTRPNATVEDLLEQLPGIEVEGDGSITAQGRNVENVLVDGKEFFGGDATVATKNLPADAVERVQVYEKQSDMAEFTGIPDGEEEVTINLELREEAKTGYFGSVSGGLGNILEGSSVVGEDYDGVRYDERINLSRFSPTVQLALLGRMNNNNQTGFSWEEQGQFNLDRRRGGATSGLSESKSLGINASRDFSKDTWIRTSYFLSDLDNRQDREMEQRLLLGSAISSIQDETSNSRTETLSHQVSVNAQKAFSEGHDIRLRSEFRANSSDRTSQSFQETDGVIGNPLNSAAVQQSTSSDNLSGNAQLTWRKRLSEDGRALVAEARLNLSRPDETSFLQSTTTFFDEDGEPTENVLDQRDTQDNQTLGQSQRLSLTEPIGDGASLEFFGEREATDEDRNKTVLNLADDPPTVVPRLSSDFDRTYTYLRGGARISKRTPKWWTSLSMRVQDSNLEGTISGRDADISNSYTHFLVDTEARYQFTDAKSVRLSYSTSTDEPSVTQLQPFLDNTNPLRLFEGNPNLTPEYSHSLRTEYRFFDQFSFINLFASLRVGYTDNPIVNSREVDEQARQTIRPVNTDHAWNTGGFLFFGSPIRRLGLNANVRYMFNRSTGTELVNQQENQTRILTNSITLGLENRDKDLFEVDVSTTLAFNDVNYSLNDALNQSYLNPSFRGSALLNIGADWKVGANANLRMFDEAVFGEDRNVAILNGSISKFVAGQRAEITLSVMDLLNQNKGINITNSSSAISEERTRTLGRHVMLNVTYKLGPMGMSDAGRGGRGGPPRGMHSR